MKLPPIGYYDSLAQYMDHVDILEIMLSADEYIMPFYRAFNQYYEHHTRHQTVDIIRLLKNDIDQLFVVALDPSLNWSIPNRKIKNNKKLNIMHFRINQYLLTETYGRNIRILKLQNQDIINAIDTCRFLTLRFGIQDVHFFQEIESINISNLFRYPVFDQLSAYNQLSLCSNYHPCNFPRLLLFDNLQQSLLYKEKMLNVLSNVTIHNVEVLKQL